MWIYIYIYLYIQILWTDLPQKKSNKNLANVDHNDLEDPLPLKIMFAKYITYSAKILVLTISKGKGSSKC